MLLLNAPKRTDFKPFYDIVREELKSYGISFTEEYDTIRECLTINFKSKTMSGSIGFHDYFIRYKDVVVNGKRYVLVNRGDDIIDFWYTAIPNTGGGCYFEYLNDTSKGVYQYLFEFLDRYGFPCEKKIQQLSLFDFGLGE